MSITSSSRVLVGATVVGAVLAAGMSTSATADKRPGLEVGALVGLPAAYVSAAFPAEDDFPLVRGLQPGGLPWVVGSAKAEVKASGKVEVKFTDLLFAPGTALAGTNTIGTMRVVVSCLTESGAVANVATDPFPVTTGVAGGDGKVEASLALPTPCLAPLIFVTTPTERWLAVSAL